MQPNPFESKPLHDLYFEFYGFLLPFFGSVLPCSVVLAPHQPAGEEAQAAVK